MDNLSFQHFIEPDSWEIVIQLVLWYKIPQSTEPQYMLHTPLAK